MIIRLNKFLAQSGLGSRRGVEDMISGGEVYVNGKKVFDLSTCVDTEKDIVSHKGREIRAYEEKKYIVLNKPKGYITTKDDMRDRPIVMDLIPEKYKRIGIYPVGRLDKDTEGLLLFTNDGDLAYKLSHPRFKVDKEYIVDLDRRLEDNDIKIIKKGMYIPQLDARVKGAIAIESLNSADTRIRVVINEGKKRQIRYTFKNLNYRIKNLQRIAYGPIKIGTLKKGMLRELRSKEVAQLKTAVGEK